MTMPSMKKQKKVGTIAIALACGAILISGVSVAAPDSMKPSQQIDSQSPPRNTAQSHQPVTPVTPSISIKPREKRLPNLKVDIVFKTKPGTIPDSNGSPISSDGQEAKRVLRVYLQAIVTNIGNADSPVTEVLFSCQGTTTNGRLQPYYDNECKGEARKFKVKALKPGESDQTVLSLSEGGFTWFDSARRCNRTG